MIMLLSKVVAFPAFVLPVKSAELKWGDVLKKDEKEPMFLFFKQSVHCYSHLQVAPVISQILMTKHTNCVPAVVDTLCYVIDNSLSHLKKKKVLKTKIGTN